jgi:hypothetical protein
VALTPIPVIAGTIVRISLQTAGRSGRPWDVVVDVSLDEPPGSGRDSSVLECVNGVRDAWQDHMCTQQPTADVFTGAAFIDLDSLSGVSGFVGANTSKPTHGTGLTNTTPSNVSCLVHKVCAHNRSQRNGRMFLPVLLESEVNDDGTLTAASLTSRNASIGAFNTGIDNITIGGSSITKWRVVHVTGHESSAPFRPNAWDSTDINSLFVDTRVATQRRRNR